MIQTIKSWFLFNKEPVLFTQIYFWGFFSLVMLVYSFIYKKNIIRTIFLLAVSLFFYYKTSGVFLIILIFTICSDYLWGHLIYKANKQGAKKLYVTISMIFNLFLLCYFKYAFFFTESYNELVHTRYPFFNHFAQFSNSFFGTDFNVGKLLLPAGISFFTFQSISYIIDMYRGIIKPVKSIFDYGFFVCFFPHLVAGPIVKAKEFIFQIYQPYNLSRTEFGMAAFWIMNGLGKKILADYVAVNFIDRVFHNTGLYSGMECILAMFAYSFQVYADFSGYTDMAIGVALLMGFRLKTNFNSPYKAASVSEFWQRWHISLSSWLKEYLYIPLGGNRQGTIGSYIVITLMCGIVIMLSGELWMPVIVTLAIIAMIFILLGYFFAGFRKTINTNINVMITMLLGGLWHGSSWMFITWGGLNGLGLVINKIWSKINPIKIISEKWFYRGIMIFVTLTFITFTRIWFRVGSMPDGNWEKVKLFFERMYSHLGSDKTIDIILGYKKIMLVILIGYLVHWIPENLKLKYRSSFANLPLPVLGITVVLIIFGLYQMMSAEMQPFIYFQF